MVCPFPVVYDARWQGVEGKVAHAVGADDHGGRLLAELIGHALQRGGRGIEIVAVQLYGEAAAAAVVDGGVPASADAQVVAFGDEVYQSVVAARQVIQYLGGAVGRVVVDHDDVVVKPCLLGQSRPHGVGNGATAVVDGDDHGGFDIEVLLVQVYRLVAMGVYYRAHSFEMTGGCILHLYLAVAVARVYIVKLAHTAGAAVGLLLGVEILVEVGDGGLARDVEAQVVPRSPSVVGGGGLLGHIALEQRRAHEHSRSEVEVVAQRTLLIVYRGVCHQFAVGGGHPAVGIDHARAGVGCRLHHALYGVVAP